MLGFNIEDFVLGIVNVAVFNMAIVKMMSRVFIIATFYQSEYIKPLLFMLFNSVLDFLVSILN